MARKSLVLLVMLFVCSVFSVNTAFAGKVLLKLQSQFPKQLPVAGEGMLKFIDTVTKLTNKQVRIKFYQPGKLVPPSGVLEAVSKKQVDAGFASSAYWAGKIPTAPLFLNVPFGPGMQERTAWLLHGNGMKLWQEMYDQAGYHVKVIPFLVIPNESAGWFANPIETIEDLKGLKMRFGGFAGDIMQEMGASVSFMSMGDVFPALEKGALDACEFSFPSIDAFLGFSKVVKYNYFPGWHQPASTVEFLINKDIWEKKLTAEQRFAIETAAQANMLWTMALGESAQAKVLLDNQNRKGVKNMSWPPEILAAFERAWKKVAAETAARDPFFNKVWTDLSKFRAEYAIWGKKGYLPQNCSN